MMLAELAKPTDFGVGVLRHGAARRQPAANAMKITILLVLLISLAPTPVKSDEHSQKPSVDFPLPKPCTCPHRRKLVLDSVSFEMTMPQQGFPGGSGVCEYRAYVFDEQYCPSESNCYGDIKIIGIVTLGRFVDTPRPDCNRYYFQPYLMPYHTGPYEIGPYPPGGGVNILLAWFTQNLFLARSTSGPLLADVENGLLKLSGIVPSSGGGDISAEVEVENRNGRVKLRYTIKVQP